MRLFPATIVFAFLLGAIAAAALALLIPTQKRRKKEDL